MTTVALDALPQFFDNSGEPLAGGKLFTYAAGTLTPLASYTDRTGAVPNANPVVLDSSGRANIWLQTNVAYQLILQDSAGNVIDSVDDYYAGADPAQLTAAGIVPATGGTYTGLVSFTGGATFDGTVTQDTATLNSLGIQAVHNNNLFQNSDFSAFPNGAGSYADGAIGFPKTSVLCESGSVTLAQVQQPQDGVPYAMRITQPDAGPKRVGFVQQLSAANTYVYRGQQLVLVPKLRCSISTTLRVALVAWTGAADAAPADVVNNWASTTYTAGNFFIASTATIAVTATAVTAATFADCLASSASAGGIVAPTGMNNLYLVVWTDAQVAQNVTLDAANVRASSGTESPVWYPTDPSMYGRLLNVRAFTASQAYTPTPGTNRVLVEVCGGGGGGGGGAATGAGQLSVGGGGGAGGVATSLITSAFSGVSVTVGSGGANGGIGTSGGTGGTSSFGALCQATGGVGGLSAAANANPFTTGGAGGNGSGGSLLNLPGQTGSSAYASFASFPYVVGGSGGTGPKGSGGVPPVVPSAGNAAGVTGTGFGTGGSGASTGASQGGAGGGAGAPGLVIVYEYA